MNLELVNENVRPGIVIDCGAGTGSWFIEAAELWPQAEFFLIDGNKECEAYLALFNTNYSISILSDKKKQVVFYTLKDCATATGASYYRELTPYFSNGKVVESEEETSTLDEVAADYLYDQRVILLKLDLQGAEIDAMRGGERLLANTDAIIIEVALKPYNEGAPLAGEVDEYLIGKGFKKQAELGDLCNPITREIVQKDLLYLRT